MSDNEKLREALAYEQGCRDTWDAVRGTNADMRPDASAAYMTCVQAAKTMLEKATLARAALSTPPSKADADDVERKLAAAEARLAEAVETFEQMRPHVEKIQRCLPVNIEIGRVVVGQIDAAKALGSIFDSARFIQETDRGNV